MDYLIAGGNGFIGSNLIPHILARDPDATIINLDLCRKEDMETRMGISEFQGRYMFKEGSINELASFEHYLKVSDLVINLASENDRSTFNERMEKFVMTNILGAKVLADACARNGIPLLHVSTDEVYGSCPFTVQRREEGAPLDPSNPYATTMAAGERLVALSGKRGDIPIVIARVCEVIGPDQTVWNLVPRTIKMVTQGKPPIVRRGSGEKYRDWLHVLDVCYALELLGRSISGHPDIRRAEDTPAERTPPGRTVIHGTNIATTTENPEKPKGPDRRIISGVAVFNVTSEIRDPISSIVKRVLSAMSSDLPIQESPDVPYKDQGYNPSGKKLSYHGWQARYTDLDTIIRSTVEWYSEHPEVIDVVASVRLRP
ncbi:MAG: NAD-dependent epimerase/dehydratase family protein [Candidatus Thermoplasmatota archaeon]|nr:NAD-dependent epimerase/dehydratase family protein [Candidatus Thermoplasmatota archaeon]